VENTNKRVRRYLPPETIVLDVADHQIRSLCDRRETASGARQQRRLFRRRELEKPALPAMFTSFMAALSSKRGSGEHIAMRREGVSIPSALSRNQHWLLRLSQGAITPT
jgi:hypothetical protein